MIIQKLILVAFLVLQSIFLHCQNVEMICDINLDSSNVSSTPEYLTVFKDKMYFRAQCDTISGYVLYTLNKFNQIEHASNIRYSVKSIVPNEMTASENRLYFKSAIDQNFGDELWEFDGDTTKIVADLNEGEKGSYPESLTVFDTILYFVASNSEGKHIWKYDSKNPPHIISSYGEKPKNLLRIDDNLFYTANFDGIGFNLFSFRYLQGAREFKTK